MFDYTKDQILTIYPRDNCESVAVTIAPVDLNKAFITDVNPSEACLNDKLGYALRLLNSTTVELSLTGKFSKDNTPDKYFVECKVRVAV